MRPAPARSGWRTVVAAALLATAIGGAPALAPASGAAPVTGGALHAAALAAAAGVPGQAGAVMPAALTPSPLATPPGSTSLVSAAPGGGFLSGSSSEPSVSADGRYVAFTYTPPNAPAGAVVAAPARVVYLRDRTKRTTVALPVPGGPVPSGASAFAPSISADGSVVAFAYTRSVVSDLAATTATSIVVWDRSSGKTSYVTNSAPGSIDQSREPSLSGGGRYVAFTSDDTYLAPGDKNRAADVFRYDRQSGQTVLVSVGLNGTSAPGGSSEPSISGDGSVVAFASMGGASLVANGAAGFGVYARDLNAGQTTLVSVRQDGSTPTASSDRPAISDDGRYVAFQSADNLLSGVAASGQQVYLRDRQAGTTTLVSAQADGSPSAVSASFAGISRDGRMVAYVVSATSLNTIAQTRLVSAVFLHDMVGGPTVLISVNQSGVASVSANATPKVAGAGRFVVFASNGADLVAGGVPTQNVYIRDMPPVPQLKPAKIDFGTRAVGVSPTTAAGVLSNAGWGPLTVKAAAITGANAGDFAVLADGCSGQALYLTTACTVTLGFAPTAAGSRTAVLQIPDSYTGSPRKAQLVGLGSSARIVLDPPVGPPGLVVMATGSGFPTGAQMTLTWSAGITPVMPAVTADAKGGFKVPVLIIRNDQLGQRNLVATWVGGPQFPTLQVPMLVTVGSAMPPGFWPGFSPGGAIKSLVFRG